MRINEPINSSMKQLFRIDYFLFFLFLTCPSIIKAENESALSAHHANYSVSVRGIGGTLNTKLNQDDGTYQASNELKARGLSRIFLGGTVNEKSYFRITDKELMPLSFYSTDKMSKTNKTISLKTLPIFYCVNFSRNCWCVWWPIYCCSNFWNWLAQ